MYAQQQHHRLEMSTRRQNEKDNLWLSQNWGLVALAAIAVATMTVSAGTQTEPSKKAIREFPSVPHQTLFASVGSGITVMGGLSPPAAVQRQQRQQEQHPRIPGSMALRDLSWSRRVLQDTVEQPVVEYEAQLELFICNPALETERNDSYLVGTDELVNALSKVEGLNQDDVDEIAVTISTGTDDVDEFYKCTAGALQWHASIKYPVDTAASLDTTPAVMAAQANDYVSYSQSEFKELLTGYINDEYASSHEAGGVELVSTDILVPVVGWIVTFPEDNAAQQATAGNSNGIAAQLMGDFVMWPWWVWLIYALLVACCLVPLCCIIFRRNKDDEEVPPENLATTREGRKGEGLKKIYGPEWGITELDFEADYHNYQSPEMKQEYEGANKGVKPTGYRASRPGHQSVGNAAWMQEAGKRSEWAAPSPSSPPRGSAFSPARVRRFDIDDDDDDMGRLRDKHPEYSFDRNSGGSRGRK